MVDKRYDAHATSNKVSYGDIQISSNHEFIIDPDYVHKHQNEDIQLYYEDLQHRRKAGVNLVNVEDKNEVTVYSY